jgi:hypothetical protein
MSLWSRALDAGTSLVRAVAPAVIPGAAVVALARSSRTAGIAIGSGVEGVVGGAAGLFGSGAQSWAERHTRNGMSALTGIDLNNLSKDEQRLADGSRTVGNVAGIGATLFIPGGIAVRGAGLALRGVEAASVLARAPGAARAAGFLAESVARVNPLLTNALTRTIGFIPGINATGRIAVGAGVLGRELLLGEMDNRIFNPLFPSSSPSTRPGTLRASFGGGASAIIPSAHAADGGPNITTGGANAQGTSTQNSVTEIFTAAAADGYVSNEDIAQLRQTTAAIRVAELSDADRTTLAQEAANIIRDFERNPPHWTDARTAHLQTVLNALGYENSEIDAIYGNDTKEMVKQFKLDHRTLFDAPAPTGAGTRNTSAPEPAMQPA